MNTQVTKQIIERFYSALDAVIAKNDIRGIATYCNMYGIDRRNMLKLRKNPERGTFKIHWLQPIVKDFGVNAEWLLTGVGRMFKNQ